MAEKAPHFCIMQPEIFEIKGKMKWNYELTLMEMTQIKTDVKDMKSDIKDIKDSIGKITEFTLTAPQKFADWKDFELFKDNINTKIAFISWIFAVLMTVIQFILNKYM